MNSNKRVFSIFALLALGIILTVVSGMGMLDEFWSGMGFAMVFVSALNLYRLIRYRTNTEYRENVDTALADERNKFLRIKAWSWSGYLYMIVAAFATIAFKFMGNDPLMFAASGSVCLMLVLYWVSYLVLKNKY